MTKPVETVRADQCKGQWIKVEKEPGVPIRVRPTVVKEEGRGFVRVGFKHPSVGTTSLVFPRGRALELWP